MVRRRVVALQTINDYRTSNAFSVSFVSYILKVNCYQCNMSLCRVLTHVVCTYLIQSCQMPCVVMLHISLLSFLGFRHFPQYPELPFFYSYESYSRLLQDGHSPSERSDEKKATTTPNDQRRTFVTPPSYADTRSESASIVGTDTQNDADTVSLAPTYIS